MFGNTIFFVVFFPFNRTLFITICYYTQKFDVFRCFFWKIVSLKLFGKARGGENSMIFSYKTEVQQKRQVSQVLKVNMDIGSDCEWG
jgi:hypothetical protein